jgi:hypothetical protein
MPKTQQPSQDRYERQRQKSVAVSKTTGKVNKQAVTELMNAKRVPYRNGGKVRGRK